ncbi:MULTISPECIES: ABC transporter permease [Brachybacterium]|uniref:Glycine/betaine ABC transporter n=1 Tax=Brachybacterium alimentarium TaxID=47845 RepID=A0A2A3YLW8_9MICO|nr:MULTISPECIES: ABC transporter permease subunit [Brachybacterium]PCC35974.1 glycine/betaine ABC transporter [Brachybacterium alimentarium]PCC40294.1 glycine/betaine ABC transporter [Brachybacterium alimentarium]RCS63755.1 ABC transporter permease subunit [Brachybacterium sp. JB7]RCS68047.1 ABC transporter permease subunit [Brachybacterium alimentarium]RCS79477.1 ABC transporter permease subunit [Brachybacterium alimentarium]
MNFIPRIPIGEWAESGIDWLTDNVAGLFDVISAIFNFLVGNLTYGLTALEPLVMIVILALIAWVVRSWQLAIGTAITFLIVLSMEQWVHMMETMALVLVATVVAVVIAVPVGILAASNRAVSSVVRPIMDFMQTMPAFVYLIPAVTFFSIGVVPGMVATIIFALPPGVRMTELGIRQVDGETVEAGEAFGASSWQILRGIQLPLAVPTIMAGVNQVIMLALSMGVIAGMIGAPGLGKEVVAAISSLDLALGVEAGLGVVILAVYLDRITAALGDSATYTKSALALVQKARARRATGAL